MRKRRHNPLPSGLNSGDLDASALSFTMEHGRDGGGDADAGPSNWRNSCKTLGERYLQMLTNAENQGWPHDVTFEVGSTEKVLIPAHRGVLVTNCQFFEDLFRTNTNDSGGRPMSFPQLDPVGFKKALHYIYADTITMSGSDTEEIFATLQAARLFGLDGLATLCNASLRLQIESDNVVEMFHLAQERNEKRLEELTRNHISRNIQQVFLSPRFLHLSEDALCSLLNMDEWNLKELEVFFHVKRWSLSKLSTPYQIAGEEIRGNQMRATTGQALFAIRFPLMTEDEFCDQVLVDKHEGLFSGEETQELYKYFHNLRKNLNTDCLKRFVSRPRLHQTLPLSSATAEENAEETKPKIDIENCAEHKMEVDDEQLSGGDMVNNVSLSSVSIIHEDPELVIQPPPPKKSRVENPRRVGTNHSEDYTTVQKYVNALEKRNDKDNFEVIDETLHFNALPHQRVHLPNLKELRLRLKLKKPFKCASKYRNYVYEKTTGLDRLLFFNKAPPNVNTFSTCSQHNLNILLLQNVNISVHFDDCLILKVNHDQGELIMNMVDCAQEIIDSLGDFPLKKLAINRCVVSSLAGLRQDLLDTVVINIMGGLEGIVEFFDTCPFLREIASNCSVSEIGRNIISLQRLLSSHELLEKVSFAKRTLSFPATPRSLGSHSSLKELHLGLSNCPYVLGSSYPNLKRASLRGGKAESLLFYDIMKIGSLDWIFVEGIALNRTEENVLSDEAIVVHNFLSKVFNSDPKLESDWPTFILEKKALETEVQPGTSKSISFAAQKYDPFNASKWKGEKLTGKNKRKIVLKLIFEHFSYNLFHLDFETFAKVEFNENRRS